MESLLDELSRKLGIDPFELRRRNALAIGKRPYSIPLKPAKILRLLTA